MADYAGSNPITGALDQEQARIDARATDMAPKAPAPPDTKTQFENLSRASKVPVNLLMAISEGKDGPAHADEALKAATFAAGKLAPLLAKGMAPEKAIDSILGSDNSPERQKIIARAYDIANSLYPKPATPEKPMSLMENLAIAPRAIASGVPSISEGFWNLARGVDGLIGADKLAAIDKANAESTKGVVDSIAGPADTWMGKQIQGGAQSIGMMLPGFAASILSGGAATPAVAAAFIAPGMIQQGGQSTGAALDEGASPGKALLYGAVDAASEGAFELLPVHKLLGDIAKGSGLGTILMHQLASELPTEVATTLFQNMNAYVSLPSNKDKTFGTFLSEQPAAIRDTIAQTIVATAGVSAGGAAISRMTGRGATDAANESNNPAPQSPPVAGQLPGGTPPPGPSSGPSSGPSGPLNDAMGAVPDMSFKDPATGQQAQTGQRFTATMDNGQTVNVQFVQDTPQGPSFKFDDGAETVIPHADLQSMTFHAPGAAPGESTSTEPVQPFGKNDGKPFETQKQAAKAAKAKGLTGDAFEIMAVDNGFMVKPLPPKPGTAPTSAPAADVSNAKPQTEAMFTPSQPRPTAPTVETTSASAVNQPKPVQAGPDVPSTDGVVRPAAKPSPAVVDQIPSQGEGGVKPAPGLDANVSGRIPADGAPAASVSDLPPVAPAVTPAPKANLDDLRAEIKAKKEVQHQTALHLEQLPNAVRFQTKKNGQTAIVTKSTEEPNAWRVTYMDDKGPSGHSDHDSKYKAIADALSQGYEARPVDLAPQVKLEVKAAPAAPEVKAEKPTLKIAPVKTDTAVTPTGQKIDVQYGIASLHDLTASNFPDGRINPAYPQERQPRDRTDTKSQQQIHGIVQKFDPRQLDVSPTTDNGAMIVDKHGIVESGNGRTMMLNRVYADHPEQAKAYADHLKAQGYPVDGVKDPVLVRVRQTDMTPDEIAKYTRDSNTDVKLAMSATEQAMSDAKALPDTALGLYRGGDVDSAANADFVRAFIQNVVAPNEQGTMRDPTGRMSQDAVRRVESALLAKAYGDADLVAKLIESSDNNIKAIGGAVLDVAPMWAKMRAAAKGGEIAPEMDQTEALLEAIKLVNRARTDGRNVIEYVKQPDLLSGDGISPMGQRFLALMFKDTQQWTKPAGRDMMVQDLSNYVDEAMKSAPGADMFGTSVDPGATLSTIKGKRDAEGQAKTNDLFARPAASNGGSVRQESGEGTKPEPQGASPEISPAVPAGSPQTPAVAPKPEAPAPHIALRDRAAAIIAKYAKPGDSAYDNSDDMSGLPRGVKLLEKLAAATGLADRAKIADSWVLEQGKKDNVEFAVALDAGGLPLSMTRGAAGSVSFSPALFRAAADGKVAYITHNHPASRGPSGPDVAAAFIGFKRVVIMAHDGGRHEFSALHPEAYEAGPNPLASQQPLSEAFSDGKSKADSALNMQAHASTRAGTMTADESKAVWYKVHVGAFGHILSRMGILDYTGPVSVADIDAAGFDFGDAYGQVSGAISDRLGRAGFNIATVGDKGGNQAAESSTRPAPGRKPASAKPASDAGKPVVRTAAQQALDRLYGKESDDVSSPGPNLEPDRGNPRPEDRVGTKDVPASAGLDGRGNPSGSGPDNAGNGKPDSGGGVSGGDAPVVGKPSDSGVQRPIRANAKPAASGKRGRRDGDSSGGLPAGPAGESNTARPASGSTSVTQETNSWIAAKPGDILRDGRFVVKKAMAVRWQAVWLAADVGGMVSMDGNNFAVTSPSAPNLTKIQSLLDQAKADRAAYIEKYGDYNNADAAKRWHDLGYAAQESLKAKAGVRAYITADWKLKITDPERAKLWALMNGGQIISHSTANTSLTPEAADALAKRLNDLLGETPSQLNEDRATDSPAFKAWFGDSKVVDAAGKPLVVYHGTTGKAFDAFDTSSVGITSVFGIPIKTHRQGIYFGEKEGFAKGFAGQDGRNRGTILPVYLSIKNPLDVTSTDNASVDRLDDVIAKAMELDPKINNPAFMRRSGDDSFWELLTTEDGGDVLVQAMRLLGYDGIKMIEPDLETYDKSYVQSDEGAVTWVAFDPTQVKSVANRGTWDATDPMMLHEDATGVDPRKYDAVKGMLDEALGNQDLSYLDPVEQFMAVMGPLKPRLSRKAMEALVPILEKYLGERAAGRVEPEANKPKPSESEDAAARQAKADRIKPVHADAANIAATLPLLLPVQHDDVMKIETRFAKPDGHGMMITNGTGTGKAQPLDSNILTPSGWVKMGDISVGDYVIAADGKPTLVTGVFPQGDKLIYRVQFSDGAAVECCDDHLWETQTLYARRKASENPGWDCAKPKVRALSEIRSSLDVQHFVPVVSSVEHPARVLPIRPYTLGVILGDGCLRGGSIIVTNPDAQIAAEVSAEIGDDYEIRTVKVSDEKCATWRIGEADRISGHKHRMAEHLRAMGLWDCLANAKFVPPDYLISSIDDRTALLQGMMDTDGTADRRNGHVSFCTVSPQLADGIMALVRSLGGICTRSTSHKFYTHNSERREGQLAYVLTLSLPDDVEPFRLPRKAALVRPRKRPLVRKIVSVSLIGTKAAQCISVDHPRRLYITDDYVLTHNTYTALGTIKRFAQAGKGNVLIVAPRQTIPAWITVGGQMALNVTKLKDATDAGQGVVITTPEAFRDNDALAGRKWDLIVTDEAQELSRNAAGASTKALDNFRALTHRPQDLWRKSQMLHAEDWAKLDAMKDGDEKSALYSRLHARQQADVAKLATEPRPKALMMSATPFAYDKSIDYAEGYLFAYPPDGWIGDSRQDGRAKFMVENFGYRILSHKLSKPTASVDIAVFERQFHEKLRREGVLSGRALHVDVDYDRKFVLVHDAVGVKIDAILKHVSDNQSHSDGAMKDGYRTLSNAIWKSFSYIKRQYLLEAIKAKAAVPIIQQHLDLGRKMILFHDFNKGGGVNPFVGLGIADDANALKAMADLMIAHPDIEKMNFKDYQSPMLAMKAAFGNRAALFNGTVPEKARNDNLLAFNTDGSGVDVLVVQARAGGAGIGMHDLTGGHQRTLINIGMPAEPTTVLQQEGRALRVGTKTNVAFRYLTTGTTWERTAFANKIASNSGTVENLALGNQARSLRDTFVNAYMDASESPPSAEDGTGGKSLDKRDNTLTPYQVSKTHYFGRMKIKGRRDQREGVDFYPTPEPLGYKMVEWAGIRPNERVLEPSAGDGAIARYTPEDAALTMVEPSADLSSRAQLRAPWGTVQTTSFEDYHLVNKHHVIVMNPPFGAGGKTAIDHLAKAAKHLRDGGRIVALIPTGPSADKHFEKWRNSDEAKDFFPTAFLTLPSIAFEKAGTGVMTRVVVLDRIANKEARDQYRSGNYGSTKTINFTGTDSINAFFDRLEDYQLPDRPAAKMDAVTELEQEGQDVNDPVQHPGKPLAAKPGAFTDATYTTKKGKVFIGVDHMERVTPELFAAMRDVVESLSGFSVRVAKTRGPQFIFRSPESKAQFLADMKKPTMGFEETAYHGTPHDGFDQFSLDHIGSGEGNQAYGWGLYFASNKTVSEYYRKKLSENFPYKDNGKTLSYPDFMARLRDAIESVGQTHPDHVWQITKLIEGFLSEKKSIAKVRKLYLAPRGFQAHWDAALNSVADVIVSKKPGALYTVDVPSADAMLDWDKLLSDQPEAVKAALFGKDGIVTHFRDDESIAEFLDGPINDDFEGITGKQFYQALKRLAENDLLPSNGPSFDAALENGKFDQAASIFLRNENIPGLRYLDGSSRTAGEGHHNYVVFDDSQIKVLSKEQRQQATSDHAEAVRQARAGWSDVVQTLPVLRAELDRLDLKRVQLKIDPTAEFQGLIWNTQQGFLQIIIGASLNPKKTVYHEVIHALKMMNLFTEQEWQSLERAAVKQDWLAKHDIPGRYPTLSHEDQIEEAIAEEFAEAGDARPQDSFLSHAFAKVARVLRAFRNALSGSSWTSPEDIFGAVMGGEISRRTTGAKIADGVSQQRPVRPLSAQGRANRNSGLGGAPFIPDRRIWETISDASKPLWDRLRASPASARDMVDRVRVNLQDRFLPFLRAQQAVELATGKVLGDSLNVWQQQKTYSGKTAKHLADIDHRFVNPIIQTIADSNGRMTEESVSQWLYARHATERNARMASINPDMGDGGSGMKNAVASAILGRVSSSPDARAYTKIGKLVDAMREFALGLRVNAGLIKPTEADQWRKQYAFYVPLKGFAEADGAEATLDVSGLGRRYSVRGAETKRALGRESEAFSPLQSAITQAQEASIRSEKNRVAAAMYFMAKQFPSPALWSIKTPTQERYFNKSTGLVETRSVDPISMILAENEMAVKINGEERRILFHDQRLMRAAGTLGADNMGAFQKVLSSAMMLWRAARTSLAPPFLAVNAIRDAIFAQINLDAIAGEHSNALRIAALRDWPKALAGVYRGQEGHTDTKWAKYYDEFQNSGAKVAFVYMGNPDEAKADLNKRINLATGNLAQRTGKKLMSPSAWVSGRDNPFLAFTERVNMAVENATRLSVFVAARKQGLSEQKSAVIARDVTLDFNTKGEYSTILNILYGFFNASVQGATTVLNAVRYSKVQRIAVGLMALGYFGDMVNANLSATSADGMLTYDRIPEYQNQSSVHLPFGGDSSSFLAIPIPYGFNIFTYLGQEAGKISRGVTTPEQATANIASAAIQSFSPINGSDAYSAVTPTMFSPILDLRSNKNWLGNPIKPDDWPGQITPDSEKYFKSVTSTSKALSQWMNSATGGTRGWSGAVDISPEYLDYIAAFVTGSAGSFWGSSIDLAQKALTGDTSGIETANIPIVNRFVHGDSSRTDQTRYYRFKDMVERANFAVKQAAKYNETLSPEILKWASLGQYLKMAERARSHGSTDFYATFNARVTEAIGKIAG